MPTDNRPLHEASASTSMASFKTDVQVPGHSFVSDVPRSLGGEDAAASPMALLTASLAACTTMTVRSYASRKGWPLESVSARVEHLARTSDQPERFTLALTLAGELTPQQAEALEAIAHKCPVHKVIAHSVEVHITRNS